MFTEQVLQFCNDSYITLKRITLLQQKFMGYVILIDALVINNFLSASDTYMRLKLSCEISAVVFHAATL
jgi:hypothetical protein